MTSSTAPHGGHAGDTGPLFGGPLGALNSAFASMAEAAWRTLMVGGVAAAALGVVILAWPHATLHVVAALFAAYLLVSGVFQLIGAFGIHITAGMRALHFISGALSVLLGLLCLRSAADSLLLLALWIGFGWLIRGTMLAGSAIGSEGMPGRGWQLFLGVITTLAGIVLILSPFGSLAALTLASGVWLIVVGVTEVIHGISLRVAAGKAAKHPADSGPAPA